MAYECLAAKTNDDLDFFGTPEIKSAKMTTQFPNFYGIIQNDTDVYNSYILDPLAKVFLQATW